MHKLKVNVDLILVVNTLLLIALLKYVLSFTKSQSLILSAGVICVGLIILSIYTIYLRYKFNLRR